MQKDIKQLDERMTREFATLRAYIDQRFAAADAKFATKEDLARELGGVRSELSRTIYVTSLAQLIAIIASVISLVMILKK
ncbi:hypothetical protein [Paraflavitalea pollutisoli]|uniref:hypothetical protein n=1 Tax=Paraflavitalea pollutisoli TaxID=3034143 RepID=UPI0023EC3761|nr:hypothetical protein [Paraflavitalea sp. H1-2-19X]